MSADNTVVGTDERRYENLTRTRLEDPDAVTRAARARRRHAGPAYANQTFIIAADHPARGALSVGSNPTAMADRRDLLDRLQTALRTPGCDGVLATPDIIDDLLLLGALDDKLVFGSMNRAGLAGSSFEFDDRFTGHTAEALDRLGADGGKMLARIAYDDPATPSMLESAARAVDELAGRDLIAMVEPFLSTWRDGSARNDLSTDAVIKSVSIASALGASSAHTWMKIPVVDRMDRVLAATTLPTVLLGGDTGKTPDAVFASWENALRQPGVIGLTVGRTLLYPPDDDVAGAVGTAVSLLNRSPRQQPSHQQPSRQPPGDTPSDTHHDDHGRSRS